MKKITPLVLLLAVIAISFAVSTKLNTSSSTDTNVGVVVESVNPTTGSVTTETSGITIVRDRGARFNFIPAKAGMNNGGVTSGPATK